MDKESRNSYCFLQSSLFGNLPLFTSFLCVCFFQFLVEPLQKISSHRSFYFKYGLNFNALLKILTLYFSFDMASSILLAG